MYFRRILQIVVLLVGFLVAAPVLAQQVNPQNLSSVRVDELTDAQIRQFMSQVESLGLSDSQFEQVAQARGMSPTEIQKLRQRVEKIKKEDEEKGKNGGSVRPDADRKGRSSTLQDSIVVRPDSVSLADQALSKLRSRIFGADLFKTSGLTFEPNLRLATPRNYIVGPDDELLLDIYGYSEASYRLTVTPEGTINIPYVGVVSVGGMTIESATSRIKSRLSTIYSGIKTGNTSVSVAVGSIRSIKVILTGEVVKPGTYTIPSVATVFNALYSSGGPTENGSFRQIEVIRGGKKLATLDVYDFLLTGELKNNVRLQDQDVIRIPTYRKRVEIVGEVKRPGVFEMVKGEELADLLRFAGDFTERAYQARIKVLKNTATEREISDVTSSQFATYQPSTGDKYFVEEILDRFANRVTINGAVFRPGYYELNKGLTLRELINKAEGLREDAFLNRGYITRLKEDLQVELISFDVAKVVNGQGTDIQLKREDVVEISSVFDLKEEFTIQIDGEIRNPGQLKYAEGMTLEDAILQAGGLKEGAAAKRIEVSRRVKNSNVLSASAQTAEVFRIDIDQNLNGADAAFLLQPFDIVVIRQSSGYEVQRQVRIEGEVLYPGAYTLRSKDERISDLITRAGGFTKLAYLDGGSLKRPSKSVQDSSLLIMRNEQLKRLQQLGTGENLPQEIYESEKGNEYVGIDLPRIVSKPKSKEDLFLEEGDVVYVPKQLQTVKVNGAVLSPVTVMYERHRGVRGYISSAGGFSDQAKKGKTYVIYANGSLKATKKMFLFFNNFPTVRPGAEIFVPVKPEGRKVTAAELVGVSTGLASLAAIILSLFR